MNVVKSKSSRANALPRVKSEVQPAKVNLYQEIPNLEVSLDDFEEFALDRLKVRAMGYVVPQPDCLFAFTELTTLRFFILILM